MRVYFRQPCTPPDKHTQTYRYTNLTFSSWLDPLNEIQLGNRTMFEIFGGEKNL